VALVLFIRRTSVQPAGALIVAVFGRTAIEAIITSLAAVPAGFVIVSEPEAAAADEAERNVIVAAAAGVREPVSRPATRATVTATASSQAAAFPMRRGCSIRDSSHGGCCDGVAAMHEPAFSLVWLAVSCPVS
jgi:hypothetical protein